MSIRPSQLDFLFGVSSEIEATEDPYYGDTEIRKSWFLEGSPRSDLRIEVEAVWDDYSGSGIKVGVLDSQIDYTHDDLSAAYDQSLDFNFALGTGDFSIKSKDIVDTHGTLVAGVISAEADNSLGTVGIASGATLVGLAMDYNSSGVVEQALAGIRAGTEVDVLNNSWSFTSNFADNFSKSANAGMADALEHTATEGRDGLGTSMVFAAGNMGTSGTSNYHNFQNSPYTIAVGAVHRGGDAASFTSIGSNVLLSAPGQDVYTTTPGGDFSYASGTSFAAPAVSAVIALMLEANPDLGYRDIQQILALSAKKEGLDEHSSHGNDWETNGADNFNGGGMHFSDSYGYGFLNARAAVRLAETWTEQQTVENRTSVGADVSTDQYLIAGENDRIEVEIDLDEAIDVEHVQLSMNLSWSLTGDLDVWLISPEGTEVRLVHDLPGLERVGSIKNFEFSSVASMGENSAGTWTLVIQNNNPDATSGSGDPMSGRLRGVSLEVHGDALDTEDDTYFYTDEFASLYTTSELASRTVLSDVDGGTDAINAAAVSTDSLIDLSGDGKTVIAGQEISLNGGDIENAFGGDGDDTLIGSDADNLLFGGRGDDVVQMTAGADTLDGGAGSDTLLIDQVIDTISGVLTDAGTFLLGLVDGTMSAITGFEKYQFADVVYSTSELEDHLANGEGPGGEDPNGEDPNGEDPNGEDPNGEDPNGEDPNGEDPNGEDPDGEDPNGEDPDGEDPNEEDPDGEDPNGEDPDGDDPDSETPDDYDALLFGGDSADRLRGSTLDDWIEGGVGDDYLVGNLGSDYLLGGEGEDKIRAGEDDDRLFGGDGDDTLLAEEGNDLVDGGKGNDVMRGDEGSDTMIGGAGSDTIQGGDGADSFVLDINHAGDVDSITDFSADEGDTLVIQGVSANANATFGLVVDGRVTKLEMYDDTGTSVLAEIRGQGVSELAMSQQDADVLLFG